MSIDAMMKLTRPLVCFDLETTGPFVGVDRIVDIGIVTRMPDGELLEWQTLINPGMPIPPSSTEIHGITDAMVDDAPQLRDVAAQIHARLLGADITGYNVARFDLPFLKEELKRVGDPFKEMHSVVDAMTIFKVYEPRDLNAAVRHYLGRAHEGAHRAMADARATLQVFEKQCSHYKELPDTIEGIVESLRDPNWVDDEGKFAWFGDDVRITFGKFRGHTLKWMVQKEPGFLGWMLKGDFSESTKAVAFNALAMRLPDRKEK